MTQATLQSGSRSVQLQWRSPEGKVESYSLVEGQTIVVGSHPDVDLNLPFPRVSGKHCILWMEQGTLHVRDCYSNAGTLVGGRRITETAIDSEQELQVGSCRLTVAGMPRSRTPENSPKRVREQVSQNTVGTVSVAEAPRTRNEQEERTSPPHDDGPLLLVIDELKSQVAVFDRENSILKERLETLARTEESTAAGEADPFHEEMLELLRSEIAELRGQLEERDRGSAATVSVHEPACGFDGNSTAELERLMERLESLLAELGEKDQQLALVTELLESAESDAQAARDERSRLEQWLGEVESRVTIREQDWRSQLDALGRKNEELAAARSRAEAGLLARTDDAKLESLQSLCQELRVENGELKSRLTGTEEERRQLQARLDEIDERQRQEAVRVSQERAELARMRHTFEQMRLDLDQKERKLQLNGAAQTVRDQKPGPTSKSPPPADEDSLAKRLGRLWRRLDSW